MRPVTSIRPTLIAATLAAALSAGAGPALAVTVTVAGGTTCDNYYDLYVDGIRKVTVPAQGEKSEWSTAEIWSDDLALGQTHVVAVKGSNYPGSGYNPAAFLGHIETEPGTWFLETGTSALVTDAGWKCWYGGPDATPPLSDGKEWFEPGYDDSSWGQASVIGANGIGPWGTISGIRADAQWIWTEHWETSADSPVYFRRSFTPVPEPVTGLSLLLAAGVVGTYLDRRRRRPAGGAAGHDEPDADPLSP